MTIVPRMSFRGATSATQMRLRAAYSRMEKANEQVATGKAYSRPSENQSASSRAATLQDQLDQLGTFDHAVDDAKSRLSIADTKLQQATTLYHRITELATQAANATSSPSSRLSIREEVLQLRGELEAIGNSRYLGAPLFAGFQSGNAITWNAGTSTWVFSGAPSERLQRRVGASETVDTSITAGELFSNGTDDIFTTLDTLAADLGAGNVAGIQGALGKVTSLQSTLMAGQARLGAVLNRVEQAADRNSAIRVTLSGELSRLQDVDLGEAITDQSRLTTAYQAALGVTAKANQMTLLDYWR